MIEVKDIAEYEENDSELAKYTISKLSSEKKDLQQRIDKAIEYIEDNLGKDDNGCGAWWYAFQDYQEAKDELLSILRGEDNE